MNKQLYQQRASDHLTHAKVLSRTGDYVQAGEKIWGALSALVNCRSTSLKDIKSIEDKRYCFNILFNTYNSRSPTLYPKMRSLQLNDCDEVFDAIYGFHKFFYGGAQYTEEQCKRYVPFFIELLEKL